MLADAVWRIARARFGGPKFDRYAPLAFGPGLCAGIAVGVGFMVAESAG
jgi:hypothetical protein